MCNAAVGLHEWTVLVMKRVVAIAACALSLAGCSSMPSWMQFDTPGFMKSAPAATTMQFESEPAGAEAKTSLGQACRTPCTPDGDGQRIQRELLAAGLPAADRAGAGGGFGRCAIAEAPAPRAEPGFRRIAAGRRQRPVAKKPAPAKKKPRARAAAGADRHGARAARLARPRARPRPGRRRAETGSIPPDMRQRPPTGGRVRLAFLDMARTGSLKRGRCGRLAQRESVPFTRERS